MGRCSRHSGCLKTYSHIWGGFASNIFAVIAEIQPKSGSWGATCDCRVMLEVCLRSKKQEAVGVTQTRTSVGRSDPLQLEAKNAALPPNVQSSRSYRVLSFNRECAQHETIPTFTNWTRTTSSIRVAPAHRTRRQIEIALRRNRPQW